MQKFPHKILLKLVSTLLHLLQLSKNHLSQSPQEQRRVRQSNKHDGKETTTAFPDISGKLRLNHDDGDHRGR